MNATHIKCRICLVQSECAEMHELYEDANNIIKFSFGDESNGPLKLYEKVEYCCGVRLRFCKHMPTKICSKCFNTIRIWFNFRQMCLNSQLYLESLQLSNCKNVDKRETNYLDNLAEDLQTFRTKKSEKENTELIYQDREDDFQIHTDEGNDADDKSLLKEYIQIEPAYATSTEECVQHLTENNDKLHPNYDVLLNELTSEDLVEALSFFNPEQNQQLEDYVQHISNNGPEPSVKRLGRYLEPRYSKVSAANKLKKTHEAEEQNTRRPKPTVFMCSICGNVYTKRPLFQYHLRTHSSLKPYQCEICHKAYRMMSELKNHMYRHTGERPFKCKFCERNFMDRSSRHRHERLHTNSRPFVCNICNKSFSYSAILKNHMKLHSGEKDFICTICNKSFTLHHQLKAHLLTMTHKQRESNQELPVFE